MCIRWNTDKTQMLGDQNRGTRIIWRKEFLQTIMAGSTQQTKRQIKGNLNWKPQEVQINRKYIELSTTTRALHKAKQSITFPTFGTKIKISSFQQYVIFFTSCRRVYCREYKADYWSSYFFKKLLDSSPWTCKMGIEWKRKTQENLNKIRENKVKGRGKWGAILELISTHKQNCLTNTSG